MNNREIALLFKGGKWDKIPNLRTVFDTEWRPRWTYDPYFPSRVYIAHREGLVKIGYTTKLRDRLDAISNGVTNPPCIAPGSVQLLATMRGGEWVESTLHDFFSVYRLGWREWFRPCQQMQDLVEVLQQQEDPPMALDYDPEPTKGQRSEAYHYILKDARYRSWADEKLSYKAYDALRSSSWQSHILKDGRLASGFTIYRKAQTICSLRVQGRIRFETTSTGTAIALLTPEGEKLRAGIHTELTKGPDRVPL